MTLGLMLGGENSEFQVIFFFAFYPKTITRNFSESTKPFNSENMVQVCLVSFEIQGQ